MPTKGKSIAIIGQFNVAQGLVNWTVGGFHALNTNDRREIDPSQAGFSNRLPAFSSDTGGSRGGSSGLRYGEVGASLFAGVSGSAAQPLSIAAARFQQLRQLGDVHGDAPGFVARR